MSRIIFFIIIAMIYSNVFAQDSIDINTYTAQSYNYNIALKQSAENIDYAYYALLESKATRYPQLEGSVYSSYTFRDYPIDAFTSSKHTALSSNVSLTQNIYSGGATKNSIAVATLTSQKAKFSKLYSAEVVVVAANTLYWSYIAYLSYVEIAKKYVDIIRSNYELIKIKFDDGIVAKNELLMMETQLKQAEYGLTQAELGLDKAKVSFNIFRGKDANTQFVCIDSIGVSRPIAPPLCNINDVLDRNYEQKIYQLELEISQKTLLVNQAQFLPSLSVGVMGTYNTLTSNIDGSMILDGNVFVSLSTPIFGWGQKIESIIKYSIDK